MVYSWVIMWGFTNIYLFKIVQAGLDLTCSDHEHNVTASHHTGLLCAAICQQDLRLSGLLHESKDNGKVGLSVILVQVIEGQKVFEYPQKDGARPQE